MKKRRDSGSDIPRHLYEDGHLHLHWPETKSHPETALHVPLGLWIDGHATPLRKWQVRQGGAQAKFDRRRGFVAVNFRRPAFLWKGRLEAEEVAELGYLHRFDLRGWRLWTPTNGGEAIEINEETYWEGSFECGPTNCGPDDEKANSDAGGASGPRFLWLSRITEDESAKVQQKQPGILLSLASPSSFSGAKIIIKKGRLSLSLKGGDLRPSKGWLPDLYLVSGIRSKKAALQAHEGLLAKEGFFRPRRFAEPETARPTLFVTNDLLRSGEIDGATFGERIIRHLDALARGYHKKIAGEKATIAEGKSGAETGADLVLDTAWADAEGDWNPSEALFADYPAFIEWRDALRSAGHRLLLTFAPFKVGAGSLLANEASWLLLPDKAGLPWQDEDGDYSLDLTRPDARNFLEDTVEFILSEDEESLGADGLVLAPCVLPNEDAKWVDPEWAQGERLMERVLKALVKRGRSSRRRALIDGEISASYMSYLLGRAVPAGLLGRRRSGELQSAEAWNRMLPGATSFPCIKLADSLDDINLDSKNIKSDKSMGFLARRLSE